MDTRCLRHGHSIPSPSTTPLAVPMHQDGDDDNLEWKRQGAADATQHYQHAIDHSHWLTGEVLQSTPKLAYVREYGSRFALLAIPSAAHPPLKFPLRTGQTVCFTLFLDIDKTIHVVRPRVFALYPGYDYSRERNCDPASFRRGTVAHAKRDHGYILDDANTRYFFRSDACQHVHYTVPQIGTRVTFYSKPSDHHARDQAVFIRYEE